MLSRSPSGEQEDWSGRIVALHYDVCVHQSPVTPLSLLMSHTGKSFSHVW